MRTMGEVETTTSCLHDQCTVTLFRTSREDLLLRRVRAEFNEMPGMRLTLDQAMRYWTIDRPTCTSLFDSLVNARFLERDATGRYRKTHCAR
jgi:hypothetical protein